MATLVSCVIVASTARAERPSLDQIARKENQGTIDVAHVENDGEELPALDASRFSPLKPAAKTLCTGLEMDQRRETVLLAATQVSQQGGTCRACRPLGRLIASACTTKKVSRGTPVESYGRRQREPHSAVIDSAARLSLNLAQDHENAEEVTRFIKTFVHTLSSSADMSAAAKEYYEMLATVIEAPFRSRLHEGGMESDEYRGYEAPRLDTHATEQLLSDMF